MAIETMPVAERFVSINGEGPNAGRLAAFVRFVGCNLACSYCDTRWACVASCPHEELSVAQLVEWVAGTGAACVTLTGGEPALQPLLPALVEALARSAAWGTEPGCAAKPKAAAYEHSPRIIELETNGAVDLAELAALRARLDGQRAPVVQPSGTHHAPAGACGGAPGALATPPTRISFTLDCKSPSSGMASRMLASNYELLAPHDSVKFVVDSREDLLDAERVIRTHALCERCEVFLSPVFGAIEPATMVQFMQEHQLAHVRLQLQLHKIIWPGVEKGV